MPIIYTETLHSLQWRIQDFPEVGAPTPQGGRQHTILPKFPKNCMKLKEFGPRGGARPKFYYVDPPLVYDIIVYYVQVYYVIMYDVKVYYVIVYVVEKL